MSRHVVDIWHCINGWMKKQNCFCNQLNNSFTMVLKMQI